MISVLVQFSTVQAALAALPGGPRPLTAAEMAVLLSMAQEAETYIQNRWPTRTGRSRDAWMVMVDGIGLRFDNDTDYAEFVHWQGEGPNPLWDALFDEVLDSVVDPGIALLLDLIAQSRVVPRFGQAPPLRFPRLVMGGARCPSRSRASTSSRRPWREP